MYKKLNVLETNVEVVASLYGVPVIQKFSSNLNEFLSVLDDSCKCDMLFHNNNLNTYKIEKYLKITTKQLEQMLEKPFENYKILKTNNYDTVIQVVFPNCGVPLLLKGNSKGNLIGIGVKY